MRRRIAAGALALVASGVAAQAPPSGSAATQRTQELQSQQARRSADDLNRWWSDRDRKTPSGEAAASIVASILRRDCASAVKSLNEGVAKGYPDVQLLAGSMFEEGICLKASWDRAVNFYQRAYDGGRVQAGARLASGYAAPVGGGDLAAALWWGLRTRVPMPAACAGPASLVDDPDRFVAALKEWPAGRLAACAYATGVMATVQGDAEFPSRASSLGLKGRVSLTLFPAEGRMEIVTDEVEAVQLGGIVSGDALRDRDSRTARAEFARYLREITDRALRRYERPPGVPADWRAQVNVEFEYER